MSIHGSQTARWLKRSLLLAAVALAVSACGTKRDNPEGLDLDPAFLTPVAAAEEAGVKVYWLGPSFEVDGVVFTTTEAQFPEGTQGVAVEGFEIDYSSGDQPRGGILELDLLAPAEWMVVEEKLRNPRVPGVTRQSAMVAGRQAELLLLPGGARPLNALWLLLDLGDVVVVAQTNSGGAVYPGGPDYNPFINNPDLLVALMEDLRPYPE